MSGFGKGHECRFFVIGVVVRFGGVVFGGEAGRTTE
jgi:hypothetical protein